MKIGSSATSARRQSAPIKTTVMELIEALSIVTKDDALVVATMKNIFASYQVRLARTLAPVRLVHDKIARQTERRPRGRRTPTWA